MQTMGSNDYQALGIALFHADFYTCTASAGCPLSLQYFGEFIDKGAAGVKRYLLLAGQFDQAVWSALPQKRRYQYVGIDYQPHARLPVLRARRTALTSV